MKENLNFKEVKSLYQYLFEMRDTNFDSVLKSLVNMHKKSYPELSERLGGKVIYIIPEKDAEKCVENYYNFIMNILGTKKDDNLDSDTIIVLLNSEKPNYINDADDYVDVLIENKDFVCDPPLYKKLWGGNSQEQFDCPEGYYNINWYGYNRYFAFYPSNDNVYHQKIKLSEKAFDFLDQNIHKLMAAILYEDTFFGFNKGDRENALNLVQSRYSEYLTSKKDEKN